MEVLCPERLVRRPLPPNLRARDRGLFAGDLERTLPAVALRELTDVRITPDGLLFQGLGLLDESFAFPFLKDQLAARTRLKLLARSFGGRRRRLERRALWITDTWSVGFFHWLADALTRLYLVRDRADEFVLLFPHAYQSVEYVRASLAVFKLGEVDFLRADELLLCRTLTVPDHAAPSGHYDETVIRALRERLVARYGGRAAEAPAHVYISRRRARRRRIANESAVTDALLRRGFHIVEAEGLAFQDQVKLLGNARVLVSNHGAGLTTMMFMPEGARVLELRHESDGVNNCYFTLAAALGLEYFYQGCAAVNPAEDPHSADVRVDIEALHENLDLVMAR